MFNRREMKFMKDAYRVIIYAAVAVHLVLAMLFHAVGLYEIVPYNIALIMFYIVMVYLVEREYYKVVFILMHLEVAVFAISHTLLLGWEYGFSQYFVAMMVLVYYIPFKKRYATVLVAAAEMTAYTLLAIFTMDKTPWMSIGPEVKMVLSRLELMNSLLCLGIILLGALFSRVSLSTMKEYQYRFIYDDLTGLYRRDYFMQRVREVLDSTPDQDYYLLCTDIAEFKIYNELYGRDRGDEVLKAHADLMIEIKDSLAVYGRLEGDVFGMLLPAEYFSEKAAKRYNGELQKMFSDDNYRMNIHVGAYKITDRNEPVTDMYEKVRIAIDSIREAYEIDFVLYQDSMLEKITEERKLIGEFSYALANNQFVVYYQPQTHKDGKVIGAEALVRWNHPRRGLLAPGKFLPVYEQTGFVSELDLFVWREVAKTLKKWKDMGRDDLYVSINLSAKDFEYLDIYTVITELVAEYEISPRNLKLEITETVMMEDMESKWSLFAKLQALGFEIEIDDFGTGYSSLNTLKDICADVLKLDMEFIRKSAHADRSEAIIKNVVKLSDKLGMRVIVEGVEHEEQLNNLDDMGCNIFQGYYFSQPIPVEEFEQQYL